jgi:hypothetical protein
MMFLVSAMLQSPGCLELAAKVSTRHRCSGVETGQYQRHLPHGRSVSYHKASGEPAFTREVAKPERRTFTKEGQTMPQAYLGIDIAKSTFDVALLWPEGKPHHKRFNNTQEGFALTCPPFLYHRRPQSLPAFSASPSGFPGALCSAKDKPSVEPPRFSSASRAAKEAANCTGVT